VGAVWTGVEGAVAGWVVSVASAGVAPWRAALRRAASCWIICRITADRDCCCAGCVSGFWAYAPPLSSAHPAPSDSVRIRFVADRGKTPPRPANVLGSQYHRQSKSRKRGGIGFRGLCLGQEFVFINHGGDGHLAVGRFIVEAHHRAFASNPNALGEGYLGRES